MKHSGLLREIDAHASFFEMHAQSLNDLRVSHPKHWLKSPSPLATKVVTLAKNPGFLFQLDPNETKTAVKNPDI